MACKDRHLTCYGTANELSFLRHSLGSTCRKTSKIGRAEMLVRYRRAILKRSEWGKIRKNIVLEEIDQLYLQAISGGLLESRSK